MTQMYRKRDFIAGTCPKVSPGMSAVLVLVFVVAAGSLLAWFAKAVTDAEFKQNNCVKTLNTRERQHTTTVLAGKVPVSRTDIVTETEWHCDNGSKWR